MTYEWAIGVGLVVVSCVVSNLGLNLQKLYHIRAAQAAKEGRSDKRPYACQPFWMFGFGMVLAGSLLDFAALAFAAQTVVAPLGSLTLVTNVCFAPYLNGERASRRDIAATFVIIIGSALSVSFGNHSDSEANDDEVFAFFGNVRFAIYGAFMVAFITFLYAWLERTEFLVSVYEKSGEAGSRPWRRYKKLNRFLYACLSGITGAQSVLFAKAISSLARAGFFVMWTLPAFYPLLAGMLITIVLQIRWVNAGLKLFDALYMVPVFQSFWIVFSVISGLVVYSEADQLSSFAAAMFLVGIAVTVSGVYSLSQRAGSKREGMLERQKSLSLSFNAKGEMGPGYRFDPEPDASVPVASGVTPRPSPSRQQSFSHVLSPMPGDVTEVDLDLDLDLDIESETSSNHSGGIELENIPEAADETEHGDEPLNPVEIESDAPLHATVAPLQGDSSPELPDRGQVTVPFIDQLAVPEAAVLSASRSAPHIQFPDSLVSSLPQSRSHEILVESAAAAAPARSRPSRRRSSVKSLSTADSRNLNDSLSEDQQISEFSASPSPAAAASASSLAPATVPTSVNITVAESVPVSVVQPASPPEAVPAPSPPVLIHVESATPTPSFSSFPPFDQFPSSSSPSHTEPFDPFSSPPSTHTHHSTPHRQRPLVDTRAANGRPERILIDSPDPRPESAQLLDIDSGSATVPPAALSQRTLTLHSDLSSPANSPPWPDTMVPEPRSALATNDSTLRQPSLVAASPVIESPGDFFSDSDQGYAFAAGLGAGAGAGAALNTRSPDMLFDPSFTAPAPIHMSDSSSDFPFDIAAAPSNPEVRLLSQLAAEANDPSAAQDSLNRSMSWGEVVAASHFEAQRRVGDQPPQPQADSPNLFSAPVDQSMAALMRPAGVVADNPFVIQISSADPFTFDRSPDEFFGSESSPQSSPSHVSAPIFAASPVPVTEVAHAVAPALENRATDKQASNNTDPQT